MAGVKLQFAQKVKCMSERLSLLHAVTAVFHITRTCKSNEQTCSQHSICLDIIVLSLRSYSAPHISHSLASFVQAPVCKCSNKFIHAIHAFSSSFLAPSFDCFVGDFADGKDALKGPADSLNGGVASSSFASSSSHSALFVNPQSSSIHSFHY